MHVFLSHNSADKPLARSIGAHLVLVGADVWFDEWEIQAGDSVPGLLNEGLKDFDVFLLIWSKSASRSNWVRQELHSAIVRAIADSSAKIILCKVDDTPLPPLIADRRYIDLRDVKAGIQELVGDITGVRSRRARLLAIQEVLNDLEVRWTFHPGVGYPILCCPECGEEHTLEPWEATDYKRDDVYWGLRCKQCGWSGGEER